MKIKDFKLERYFAKYEFKAQYILCASDCESFTVEELLNMDKNADLDLRQLKLGYTESQGHPALLEEISKLYSNITPNEIITFAGAEEGIFVLMNALLEKGDHIIVQFPAYQSLFEIAHALGCEVTKWQMNPKDWSLNLDDLASSIKDNTKLIVVNTPHNPTGSIISQDIFRSIIQIAQDNNLFLFSDEVYRYSEYNLSSRLPSACSIYDKAISLGVMSKTFGLAGLRIGWIATKNKELFIKISAFKDYTTICNSGLSEFFAILALRNKDYIVKRNLNIIKTNLNLLDDVFSQFTHLIEWVKPTGGAVGFPRIISEQNIEGFCSNLLKHKGVLLLPSTVFNYGEKHFRIGFGRSNLKKALELFTDYLEDY